MSTLVKLRSRAQITLPKEAVKKLKLKEGDNLSIEVDNGKVIITPVAVIPKDEMLKAQPHSLEKQLKKTLHLLQENPAHPSLSSKKYQSNEGVWESSVNMKYRILWAYGVEQPDVIVLLAMRGMPLCPY